MKRTWSISIEDRNRLVGEVLPCDHASRLLFQIHNEQVVYVTGPKIDTHNEEMIEMIRRAPKTPVENLCFLDVLLHSAV